MRIIDLFKKNKSSGASSPTHLQPDLHANGLNNKPVIAFEIFPPKPDVPLDTIYDHLDKFEALKPDYISVTYGAGGSQKGRTLEIAARVKNQHHIESMAHFTCAGHNLEDIDVMLEAMKQNGLENILALRGDPPENMPDFDFSRGVFSHACELVEHIRRSNGFCIAAATHMEGHIESRRLKEDLLYLKEKVDAGVNFLVTQFFFDNRIYYDFIDKALAVGIKCPVIPGIMPVFKADQIKSMTAKSGCSIPARLVLTMDKYRSTPEDMLKAGIEYAAAQISDLVQNGADGIHLYTMNRPKSTREILTAAGLR
jgi:methylenetetrahydrofolate reductase (NADPH)